MQKRLHVEDKSYRPHVALVQSHPEPGTRHRQLWMEPVADGREKRIQDLLMRLQDEAPAAYLATMTVIESLVRREVQQRNLDEVKDAHERHNRA
jgi:hypothetical protein